MSFLKNVRLFFTAREKVFNNFKSRAFPIINQDKTLTPKPTPETTPETSREPTLELILEPAFKTAPDLTVFDTPKTIKSKIRHSPCKLRKEFLNKIGSEEKNLNNKIF